MRIVSTKTSLMKELFYYYYFFRSWQFC